MPRALTFDNILRNISTPSFDLGTAYATSLVLSSLTVACVVPAAVLRHAFLIVMSGLFLVPIYIAVVNVFKTREDIFANPLSIPLSRLTFDNILRNISTPSFDLGTAYATSES